MTLRYPVDLFRDGEAITALLPGLPGGTSGDTEAEALEHAEDLFATIVAHAIADGTEIPAPPAAGSRPTVGLRADVALKLAVNDAFRASGLTKPELAERLGWHHPQVNRILDPFHLSRIDQVVKVLQVLGKRVDILLEDIEAPPKARRRRSKAA